MKQCLVVDNSDVIRKIACKIMQRLSFATDEAENGQQALEKCSAHMPDVILVDSQMPVMGGIEFMDALRLIKGQPEPLIFYCTTENDPADISRALSVGAHEYILKPYDTRSIEAKFAEIGYSLSA